MVSSHHVLGTKMLYAFSLSSLHATCSTSHPPCGIWVIPHQSTEKRDISNLNPSELNYFFDIVVVSITSALTETQSSFYSYLKANTMTLPMTYYTNIFSILKFSSLHILTLTMYFSKGGTLIGLKKILCACNYYLTYLQTSNWDSNGIRFHDAFYCNESLHLYWWGNLKQHIPYTFLTFINLGYIN
jgi:hypothetical protein